ncbi:hypothetical protein LTR86_010972 [Recurvomyces mirabilis]|nr:hypothetical protein LTR86_010972 [Recurvomyces mirabilis]
MNPRKRLRATVLDFIKRDQTGFQDELSTPAKPQSKKRPRIDALSLTLRDHATKFLADRFSNDQRPETKSFSEALGRLQQGSSLSLEVYTLPPNQEKFFLDAPTPSVSGSRNRQNSVMEKYNESEQQSHFWESIRRLSLLWVVYEIERLQPVAQRNKTVAGRTEPLVAAAERKFSELSDVPVERVRDLRKRARIYLDVAKQTNGLGMLLMLGTQSRDLWVHLVLHATLLWLTNISWENRITDTAAPLIWEFCKEQMDCVVRTAEIFQPIACKMLKWQFAHCDIDPAELQRDGHLFFQHFKQPPTMAICQHENTTLEALAAVAAREMQARGIDESGHERAVIPSTQRDSTIPSNLRIDGLFDTERGSRLCRDSEVAASAAPTQTQAQAQTHPIFAAQNSEPTVRQQAEHHELQELLTGLESTSTSRGAETAGYPYTSALQDWPTEDLDDFLREWDASYDTSLTL